MSVLTDNELLTYDVVAALLGFSARTVRRMVAEGEFPHPIKSGRRAVRFIRGEVEEWIERRKQERRVANAV